MKPARTAIVLSVLLGMTGLTGCGSKMSKVAQGLTPLAANFYVLNHEVDRVRQAVRAESPEQTDAHLTKYDDLVAQMRTMAGEIAADPELKKHENLRVALSACLSASLGLLDIEQKAIANYAAESRLGIEIQNLAQTARGNSIRIREIQGRLDGLSNQQQQYHQSLFKLLPELAPAAKRCQELLKQYNDIVAAEKIVSFFNAESLYDPFSWEQGRAERRKPVAKPKTARKPARRR